MTKNNEEPYRQTFNDERDDLAEHFSELAESIKDKIQKCEIDKGLQEVINPIHLLYLS